MKNTKSTSALIVGGSSGMGLAVARRLIKHNMNIIIVGSSSNKLNIAERELSEHGSVVTFQADLYNIQDVQRIIDVTEDQDCHIKYFVNAAGKFKPTPFLDHKHEDYDTYLNLNRSAFFITQAVAKNMVVNGGGSIIHIGSMWAKQAIKATPSSAYSMAKAGLHALTQHMAMELADNNIRVNAVSPAIVKTPIYETRHYFLHLKPG